MKNTFRLMIAVLLLWVSFAPGVAQASHHFGEPCPSGQELTIWGFTAWSMNIYYRLVASNDFGEHEYMVESYFQHEGEGWGTFIIAAVRNVNSWERVADVQVSGAGSGHFVWIDCSNLDSDPEEYGPYFHSPYSD